MLSFIKTHWLAVPTGILVVIAVGLMIRGKGLENVMAYIVTARDLREEVSVTGRVKPAQEVDLAFAQSGLVASVNAKVGEHVEAGTVLASLDSGSLTAQVAQAQASLQIEQAALAGQKAGGRLEDVQIAKLKVETAQQTLANKEKLLSDAIETAEIKVTNSFSYYIDQFFTNPKSGNPQFNIQGMGEYETSLERDRLFIQSRFVVETWANVSSVDTSLRALRDFVSSIANVINDLTPSSNLPAATIDAYKSDVASVRTTIETELSNVTAANQAFSDAKLALTLATDQYELTKSPARPEDIAAQEARVARAEADVARLQAGWRERILYAPFGGLVTEVDYKVGQTVSVGSAQLRMISDNSLQIEAYIPEADIAGIKAGLVADVTLDAYSQSDIFTAKTISIDPAETVIEGVPTYRVLLVFDTKDERIKTGMTANLVIVVDTRVAVVAVPNRLITRRDGRAYVKTLNSEIEVATGLRSADGYTEIINGVKEGDTLADGTNFGL